MKQMKITAKLAERVQRGVRQAFCARATPGSPARRRPLPATSRSWLWTWLFCLALFGPLLYLTPPACTLLLYAVFFQALFFRTTLFHTNTKEKFQ